MLCDQVAQPAGRSAPRYVPVELDVGLAGGPTPASAASAPPAGMPPAISAADSRVITACRLIPFSTSVTRSLSPPELISIEVCPFLRQSRTPSFFGSAIHVHIPRALHPKLSLPPFSLTHGCRGGPGTPSLIVKGLLSTCFIIFVIAHTRWHLLTSWRRCALARAVARRAVARSVAMTASFSRSPAVPSAAPSFSGFPAIKAAAPALHTAVLGCSSESANAVRTDLALLRRAADHWHCPRPDDGVESGLPSFFSAKLGKRSSLPFKRHGTCMEHAAGASLGPRHRPRGSPRGSQGLNRGSRPEPAAWQRGRLAVL